MQRIMLKSKIHNAKVTQAELYYEGSITIDSGLLEKTDIVENERVQVVSMSNGARFETYVIAGEKGSGIICLNGPAARMAAPGYIVHIISYAVLEENELNSYKPKVIILDEKNQVLKEK